MEKLVHDGTMTARRDLATETTSPFSKKGSRRKSGFLVIQISFALSLLVAGEQIWFQGRQPITNQNAASQTRQLRESHDYTEISFALAKEQSFGFFTDIPDSTWLQMQKIHARAFPNYKRNLNEYSNKAEDRKRSLKANLRKSNWWNGDNFQIEFHCPMAQRVPSNSDADGPKWVCDPHRLATQERPPSSRNDQRNNNNNGCLIYSIGSAGKTQFEFGMIDVLEVAGRTSGPRSGHTTPTQPCEIHTFDISSSNKRNGDFATALEGAATFHPWGLGTPEEAARNPLQFKTLEETMEVLGHANRTIDILKIDCEWCEWFTYEQWLQQDIRQILVETHHAPMPEAQAFFQDLHDAGYVIFSKEANYLMGGGGVEFGFLKLSRDFFIDNSNYKDHEQKKEQQRQHHLKQKEREAKVG